MPRRGSRGRHRHLGVLLQLHGTLGLVGLDQAGEVHEHPGRESRRALVEHLGAESLRLLVVGREGRIALGLGAPVDLAGTLLHVLPEHPAPFGLVEDVGNPVAFAQDVVLLIEFVGNVVLIIGE